MAKHADSEGVPNDIYEWMDRFNVFSIYEILPEIIDLWGLNIESEIEAKKNLNQAVAGR